MKPIPFYELLNAKHWLREFVVIGLPEALPVFQEDMPFDVALARLQPYRDATFARIPEGSWFELQPASDLFHNAMKILKHGIKNKFRELRLHQNREPLRSCDLHTIMVEVFAERLQDDTEVFIQVLASKIILEDTYGQYTEYTRDRFFESLQELSESLGQAQMAQRSILLYQDENDWLQAFYELVWGYGGTNYSPIGGILARFPINQTKVEQRACLQEKEEFFLKNRQTILEQFKRDRNEVWIAEFLKTVQQNLERRIDVSLLELFINARQTAPENLNEADIWWTILEMETRPAWIKQTRLPESVSVERILLSDLPPTAFTNWEDARQAIQECGFGRNKALEYLPENQTLDEQRKLIAFHDQRFGEVWGSKGNWLKQFEDRAREQNWTAQTDVEYFLQQVEKQLETQEQQRYQSKGLGDFLRPFADGINQSEIKKLRARKAELKSIEYGLKPETMAQKVIDEQEKKYLKLKHLFEDIHLGRSKSETAFQPLRSQIDWFLAAYILTCHPEFPAHLPKKVIINKHETLNKQPSRVEEKRMTSPNNTDDFRFLGMGSVSDEIQKVEQTLGLPSHHKMYLSSTDWETDIQARLNAILHAIDASIDLYNASIATKIGFIHGQLSKYKQNIGSKSGNKPDDSQSESRQIPNHKNNQKPPLTVALQAVYDLLSCDKEKTARTIAEELKDVKPKPVNDRLSRLEALAKAKKREGRTSKNNVRENYWLKI